MAKLSWGKKLNKNTVRIKTLQNLIYYFILNPKTEETEDYYWCWNKTFIRGHNAYNKQGKYKPSISFSGQNLIEIIEHMNPITSKSNKVLILRKTDFKKIKIFWVENYGNKEIYDLCLSINQKIKEKNVFNKNLILINQSFYELENIYFYFYYLDIKINSDLAMLYLNYFLNFVIVISKKLGICNKIRNLHFSPEIHEGKDCINELSTTLSFDWFFLRNKITHFISNKKDVWNLKKIEFNNNENIFNIKFYKFSKLIFISIKLNDFISFLKTSLEKIKQFI